MSSNTVFSAFSFLGFLICAIPLYWHLEAANVGVCLFIAWTALGCLISSVNSIVWRNNVENIAPVWCDISGRLLLGVSVALPAASLCITRRLHAITSLSLTGKQHQLAVDLLIGLGIPVLQMILAYVVQMHRFDIFEGVGCWIPISNNPLSFVLVYTWPIMISVVSAWFGVISLYRFVQGRREVNSIVASTASLHRARYIRLVILACADVVATIPLTSYATYTWARSESYQQWAGWAAVHNHFSFVGQYPAAHWRANHQMATRVELVRWLNVVAAISFLLVFGFADGALRHYRMVLMFIARCLRITRHERKKRRRSAPPERPPQDSNPKKGQAHVEYLDTAPGSTLSLEEQDRASNTTTGRKSSTLGE
ncbi:STE3-like pheromone receptor [Artomyces pyxidatus]|uniref:STE3-like pheromone receptor n=1 Tax=Artomyces pyxidatus TaxID=48021 RepID=A0ACB8SZL4_9AGAM|nr:STE3-like pheromone receptor [Artomyces pyxidatus]